MYLSFVEMYLCAWIVCLVCFHCVWHVMCYVQTCRTPNRRRQVSWLQPPPLGFQRRIPTQPSLPSTTNKFVWQRPIHVKFNTLHCSLLFKNTCIPTSTTHTFHIRFSWSRTSTTSLVFMLHLNSMHNTIMYQFTGLRTGELTSSRSLHTSTPKHQANLDG